MHSFTGTQRLAVACLELGFHISFSGIVTFRNAESLRDIARQVPLERLLIETDCPLLAPVPVRGKRNEPLYLRHVARYMAQLRELVAQDYTRVDALAAQLSTGRAKAAAKLETRVQDELSALRMDRTRMKVAVVPEESDEALGPAGRDRVDYLFSANQGEPLQPLARVASGGEMSRVMLAMKTVLAETDRVPVLIFDEVDAGIGGAVAAVMGRRLRALANYHQVFCITHLPQIASQAGTHIVVEKAVIKKRTVTNARKLDRAGREEEIARMLGGLAITKAVRQTAVEMIGEAERER
jgi:DNA repair protein RecN (Recombination protein N)